MFRHNEKKDKPTRVKIIKDLTKIETPVEILSNHKRQSLLSDIEKLCALPQAKYQAVGLPLVHELTQYCQLLPETLNSYYSIPGGILDYALNRTDAALELFRQYMIQTEEGDFSDIQILWMYALYSASLLKDIGKLYVDYQVNVFDHNGHPLDPLNPSWNPLLGSLAQAGQYYQHKLILDGQDKTLHRRRLNLLLARQIMPVEGFNWIASNPEVLAIWLALLSDDWESAGTLGAILIRADAIAIQRYFNENMLQHVIRRATRAARIGTFIDNPNAGAAKEQLVGIEFIKWLMEALDSGQIMINKPPLLIVPGGLLIHPDAFKLFVRGNPEYKNWQVVQQAFLGLGLHRPNANGEVLSRFEDHSHQIHEGILFTKYAIALPPMVRVHNLNTGKDSQIPAVSMLYLEQHTKMFTPLAQSATTQAPAHLSANGQWKVLNTPHHNPPKPGFLKGG